MLTMCTVSVCFFVESTSVRLFIEVKILYYRKLCESKVAFVGGPVIRRGKPQRKARSLVSSGGLSCL